MRRNLSLVKRKENEHFKWNYDFCIVKERCKIKNLYSVGGTDQAATIITMHIDIPQMLKYKLYTHGLLVTGHGNMTDFQVG